MRNEKFVFLPLLALALSSCLKVVEAASTLQPPVKLVWHYYRFHNRCRDAEVYVKHEVNLFWQKDKSITPQLLRLLYSDCFVTVIVSSALLFFLVFAYSFVLFFSLSLFSANFIWQFTCFFSLVTIYLRDCLLCHFHIFRVL